MATQKPKSMNKLIRINSENYPGYYLRVDSPKGEILFVSPISTHKDFNSSLDTINHLTAIPVSSLKS